MRLRIGFASDQHGTVNSWYHVNSTLDASKMMQSIIEARGFGASHMLPGNGEIWEGSNLVGFVSYNGRVWADGSAKTLLHERAA